MRQWLPVLALLAGLGSFVSCKHSAAPRSQSATDEQSAKPVSAQPSAPIATVAVAEKPAAAEDHDDAPRTPFDRYLAFERKHAHEPALMDFAAECQVKLNAAFVKFAQRPSEKWIVVTDLSNALEDIETDFYGTLAVFRDGNAVVTEEWGMDLENGAFSRTLNCLHGSAILLVESASWNVGGEDDGISSERWGHVHSWKLDGKGKFETTQTGFIDFDGRPALEPKLDAETKAELDHESMPWPTWKDLKHPDSLLK